MTGFSVLFSLSFVLSTLLVFCHSFWVTNDNQIKKNSKTPAQILSELNIKRDVWPSVQTTQTPTPFKGRPTVTSFWREPGAQAPRPTSKPSYEGSNGYNLWEGMEFSYSSGDPSELQLIPMYSYNKGGSASHLSRDFSLDSGSDEESRVNQLVLPRYGIHPWLSPIISRPVYGPPRPIEEKENNIVDAMVAMPSKKAMTDIWLKTTPKQTEAVPQFYESIDQKSEDTNGKTKRKIDFNQEFSLFKDQDFSDISNDLKGFSTQELTDDNEPLPLYTEGSAPQLSTEFSFNIQSIMKPHIQSAVPNHGPFMPRPVYAPPRPIEITENKKIDAMVIIPSKNGETTPKQTEAVPQIFKTDDQKLEDMTDNNGGKPDLNRDFSLNRDQVFRDISNDFKDYSKQELTDIYDKIFNTKYPINDIV